MPRKLRKNKRREPLLPGLVEFLESGDRRSLGLHYFAMTDDAREQSWRELEARQQWFSSLVFP